MNPVRSGSASSQRELAEPAIPRTRAQRERRARILNAATTILRAGGESILQMKDLPEAADVSLATLYRYFPSKDDLLLAIAVDVFEAAAQKIASETPRGATPRERVQNHLLRQFKVEQRDRAISAALHRVLSETSGAHPAEIERIDELNFAMLSRVAAGGDRLTAQERRMLPVIIGVFGVATRRWFAGISSAAEARFAITAGCRLLDLANDIEDDSQDTPV